MMFNRDIADLAKEKGNAAFVAKDYATARSLYTHAMTIDQLNHVYPLNRAMANLKLARWDEAETDATKALELSPHNVKALGRRAAARRQLGKWRAALNGRHSRAKALDLFLISRPDVQAFIDHGGDSTYAAQELKAIEEAESSSVPAVPSSDSKNLSDAFANLLVEDGTSSYTIRDSPMLSKGAGAFAIHEFQRGDLVLSEKPIFFVRNDSDRDEFSSIEAKIRNLSPGNFDKFLSLHNSHAECACFPNLALGIFSTNSFALNGNSGICLAASRFNHSCSPNARYSFNANTGVLRIYALGRIPIGEEIFVTYIAGRNLYGNTRQFRQNLLSTRHFTCACPVCSLPEVESKMSDARRVKINELRESIAGLSHTESTQRLKVIVKGIHLLKEEGILGDADDFTNVAGIVCAYHSDWVSAEYWTRFTYETRVAEFGVDSPRAAEVRGVYVNPKSIPMAGRGPRKKFTNIRV
ncbi:hypothetical protein M413DRAFT_119347 [Hebeloma cylindrosporum]|uniref:SET domain-containing protein n=1 Tax=Hebeloma cylindrosporum TaxID=76867 RepID=A0A0C3CMM1_HEBCY|nr:hypothetical protein M413DRAFT_119347 [Hebeloma cylindrosporum h7]